MRLDIFLSIHHNISRNRAKQLIEAGLVFVHGNSCTKVSEDVSEKDAITIIEDKRVHWVSRSAMKLHDFLVHHQEILIQGKNCLDVGSSTGGFTEVLLEQGAKHIDAVDVGTDQLHEKIKSDHRVTSYEQTDIREFKKNKIFEPSNVGMLESVFPEESKTPTLQDFNYDIIVCDASFISLSQILDAILVHAEKSTEIILLFKPQFEVGKKNLRKTGVPKDEKCVSFAMDLFEALIKERNCFILGKEKSCLIGEAGNQEWIFWIKKDT